MHSVYRRARAFSIIIITRHYPDRPRLHCVIVLLYLTVYRTRVVLALALLYRYHTDIIGLSGGPVRSSLEGGPRFIGKQVTVNIVRL